MIRIAERLHPFSHQPGSRCLIPSTSFIVEAFPALIRIWDFFGKLQKEFPLEIQGPLKEFTLMQDLEKGCVTIFSEQYQLHILPDLNLVVRKNPGLSPLQNQERLSLGAHKKQEWERLKRKSDFSTIFPIWFRLGSLLKLPPRIGDDRGIFQLLRECQEQIALHRPEEILPAFEKLFLAGFSSMLVPRSQDFDYQGILPSESPISDDSPLHLLSEGAQLIRSLFVLNSGNEISLLPNLPPQFFAGRMTGVEALPFGFFDLEWTKKMVRQFHFHALAEGEMIFHFPPEVKRCRIRHHQADSGRLFSSGDSLAIKSGSHYLLDRFQK